MSFVLKVFPSFRIILFCVVTDICLLVKHKKYFMGDICIVFFCCFDFELLIKTLLKYYKLMAFILCSIKTVGLFC